MRIVFYSFLKHSLIQCKCYLCVCHLVVPAPTCWIPCSRLYVGLFPTHSIWMRLVPLDFCIYYTQSSLVALRWLRLCLQCRRAGFNSQAGYSPWGCKESNMTEFSSVQSLSCVQLFATCDPMNCSTPGLLVHHQLPEFTLTHVHQVRDAIQPSHPLSSPFPPAPNPSQHQGLFQWVNSSHEVAKVLEFQL